MLACMQHRAITCGCVRYFLYEDTADVNDEANRIPVDSYEAPDGTVYTAVRCPAHPFKDPQAHHDAIIQEGRSLTEALGIVAQHFPKCTKVDRLSGDSVLDEQQVAWSFDAKRQLVLDVPSLTVEEKATLDALTADAVSVK